jgi:hypothetical protein
MEIKRNSPTLKTERSMGDGSSIQKMEQSKQSKNMMKMLRMVISSLTIPMERLRLKNSSNKENITERTSTITIAAASSQ